MKLQMIVGVIIILALSTLGSAQITNGSFEGSGYTAPYNALYNGDTTIPAWVVGDLGLGGVHGVDLITTYWKASDGNDSVDLSGYAPGSIRQTFATIPGVSYRVTFDMSANPDNGGKTYLMTVAASGNAAQTYSYDTAAKGNTSGMSGDMKWETMTYTFVAISGTTTLQFADATPPTFPAYAGPALDNVTLTGLYGTVCHRNKGKADFKTMTFTDLTSVADHLGHGDAIGACEGTLTGTINTADALGETVENLRPGNYLVCVSGTYDFQGTFNPGKYLGDANYVTQDNWTHYSKVLADYPSLPANFGNVMINNNFVDWGAYSITHRYCTIFHTGGGSINMLPLDTVYSDNTGELNYVIKYLGL